MGIMPRHDGFSPSSLSRKTHLAWDWGLPAAFLVVLRVAVPAMARQGLGWLSEHSCSLMQDFHTGFLGSIKGAETWRVSHGSAPRRVGPVGWVFLGWWQGQKPIAITAAEYSSPQIGTESIHPS